MLKKIFFLLISVFIAIFLSLIFIEFILQLIPLISRNIPLSNDKVYVYIVGESSSLGEPYSITNRNVSYYKIFEYIIGSKIDNKNIEFIEIAGSGDSIRIQYWKYLTYRYLHPFRKGLAFIYAGKNDWDNGDNNNRYLKIYKIKLINFIKNAFFINCDFQYNYEKLILAIKSFGDDIFVTTIGGNYSGFMPHVYATDVPYKEEFSKIDDEILINKNYEKAKEMLKQLENKKNSDKSWIYYRYGKIAEFTGKVREANDLFIDGIGVYSNLIPSKYQIACIRMLAEKYNLSLVDIFDKIYNSGEIIGFNFYKDNQHPDIKVYIMLAELFARVLKEKYGDKINIEKDNISEQDVYKYFKFTDKDIYNVYNHSLDVTLVHSKRNDNVNRYVFKQVDEFLKKIIELNPYEGEQKQAIISFYSMMIEALKGNKEKMLEIYTKNKDIIEKYKYELHARICDWEEYNKWVTSYLGIEDFFDLSKGGL